MVALLLSVPLLLRIGGVEPGAVENRSLATLPKAGVEGVLDASYFSALDDYLEDHTPGRPEAITADAWVDVEVFGDSPTPEVFLGDEGWLFYRTSLSGPCETNADGEQVVAGVEALNAMLAEQGKRVLWTIAPNKETVYSEYLPAEAGSLAACAAEQRAVLRTATNRARPGGYIDLFSLMEQEKAAGSLLYHPNDTHWNSLGALHMVEEIVARLDPTLHPAADRRLQGVTMHEGDLTRILGRPSVEPTERYVIERKGVRVTNEPLPYEVQPPIRHFTGTSTGPPLFAEPTLVIHDSFMNPALTELSQYFADVTFVHWNHFEPALFATLISDAEVIVIEVVERGSYRRLAIQIGSPEMMEALAADR